MNSVSFWRLVLSLFCIIISPLLPAQIQRYNDNDGLSQNSVYSMITDNAGRLWVSTGDGVSMFNGQSFQTIVPTGFDSVHRSSFPGKFHKDAGGNIWIGGLPGIYRISADGQKFEDMHRVLGLKSTDLTTVMQCYKNQLFIIVNGMSMLIYNTKSGSSRLYDLKNKIAQPEQLEHTVYNGNDLILFTDKAMYSFNLTSAEAKQLMRVEARRTCLSDIGEMFFCSDNIYKISAPGYLPIPQIKMVNAAYRIADFEVFSDKFIIVTEDSGILIADRETGTINQRYNATNGNTPLPINYCASAFWDKQGQLWVGTEGKGIVRINTNASVFGCHRFEQPQGEKPDANFIKSFCELKNGQLLTGTLHGLYIYDPVTRNSKRLEIPGVQGTQYLSLWRDSRGRIWISTDAGLYYTEENINSAVKVNLAINKNLNPKLAGILCFAEFEGKILMSGKLGIYAFNEKSTVAELLYESGVWVPFIVAPGDGTLWVSQYQGNTNVYLNGDLNKNPISLFKRLNLRHVQLTIDGKYYLAATENGVYLLDKNFKIIRNLNSSNLLKGDVIYGIIASNNGYWLSSNKGLMWIDTSLNICRNFSTSDGLQSEEFNTGAWLKLKNGKLVFGGIEGINVFDPAQVLKLRVNAGLSLTSFKVGGRALTFDEGCIRGLKLPSDSNTLEVRFIFPDFTEPGAVKYFYRLKGADNKWTSLGNVPRIYFTNLDAGQYELYVKAIDHFGVVHPEMMLSSFTIAPPYYRSLWFILLVLLVSGSVVYGITRYLYSQRVKAAKLAAKKQEELYKLRMDISRDLHDNLGSNLTRVALLSHKLRDMPEKTNLKVAADSISRLAGEMNSQVRNIVWSIDQDYDNVEGLMSYIRNYALNFLEENGIEPIIEIPKQLPEFVVAPHVRQTLYSVVKEALTNALKYSGSKTVAVRFRLDEQGRFSLSIEDEGCGFEPGTERKFSHGLRNMVQRCDELGLKCTINSAPEKGCKVNIEGDFQLLH